MNANKMLMICLLVICVERSQAIQAQTGADKPAFDSKSLEQTFKWIWRRATDLHEQKAKAAEALRANELNDKLMVEFTRDWKEFNTEINKHMGKSIKWKAVVNSITREGVVVDCKVESSFKLYQPIYKNSMQGLRGLQRARASGPMVVLNVQFVDGDAVRVVEKDGYIMSHEPKRLGLLKPGWETACIISHDTILRYGYGISREYAKTLKSGDTLEISGIFSSSHQAHRGAGPIDEFAFYFSVEHAKAIEPGS